MRARNRLAGATFKVQLPMWERSARTSLRVRQVRLTSNPGGTRIRPSRSGMRGRASAGFVWPTPAPRWWRWLCPPLRRRIEGHALVRAGGQIDSVWPAPTRRRRDGLVVASRLEDRLRAPRSAARAVQAFESLSESQSCSSGSSRYPCCRWPLRSRRRWCRPRP